MQTLSDLSTRCPRKSVPRRGALLVLLAVLELGLPIMMWFALTPGTVWPEWLTVDWKFGGPPQFFLIASVMILGPIAVLSILGATRWRSTRL